jgi:BirA family biotin operon repressor/biotin-[acetyl-CoA-carboxylase] ligase
VVKALESCGLSDIGLKWPNDIYWQQRKLAGILVEVSGETNGPCFAVMGLGLNIRLSSLQAETIGQPWVDLSQLLGQSAHGLRNRLMAALLDQLLPVMAEYSPDNSHHWLAAWREYDCLIGKPVQLTLGELRYDGIAAGINGQGLLVLQLPDGELRAFASGEVSVRLQ